MSPAAWPGNPPGQGSGPSGTAELLCALSYGSGLAVAERMEQYYAGLYNATRAAAQPALGGAAAWR